MKVRFTEPAQQDLVSIYDYIAQDSTRYARRMVDRITSRSKQIRTHPLSGGMVPELERPDIREVIEGPYRIIYRVLESRIDVLAVVHGARLLPRNRLE